MNNKLGDKIYKLAQSIGLTFDEREAMRAHLLSKISISERAVISPLSPMFYWQHISIYIKPQYVSVALLVVLIGGGISVAAEKALPGEPLYQVKTSVNENVLGLFAFTPQSKAQLHTELAVRRLEEVEKLAISGKLDATTTATAENKIDGNLAVIKDSVKQLESENNNAAAADTSSKAESSLKVHEAILDTLVDGNAAVNSSVQDMAAKVSIQATALSLDRAGIDSRNGSTTPSIDVLLNQQKVAQEAVAFMQSVLASSTATTSVATTSTVDLETASSSPDISSPASTTIDVLIATSTATSTPDIIVLATSTPVFEAQVKLQIASDLLAQGSNKLDLKDYGDAFVLFKEAEKTAIEARTILEGAIVPEVAPVSSDISTSTATSTNPSVI